MRDIGFLGADLEKFFLRGRKEAAMILATKGAEATKKKAPHDTGFLKTQTWASVDGQVVKSPDVISTTKTITPRSFAAEGVSIVYTAGRSDRSYPRGVFDYAAYLGVYNPGHQKTGEHHWIQQILDPKNGIVELALDAGFAKAKI
jgi:hypothetical protein